MASENLSFAPDTLQAGDDEIIRVFAHVAVDGSIENGKELHFTDLGPHHLSHLTLELWCPHGEVAYLCHSPKIDDTGHQAQ